MVEVTAVFDIGKTNKKFFLFDIDYKEVYNESVQFEQIEDEDGFLCENLMALQNWLKSVLVHILDSSEFNVKAINFSAYGASFVYIDKSGKVLTPLYNYVKPIESGIIDSFINKYGPKETFLKTTGCFDLGALNSGLQLYSLKYSKPEVFKKIKYALHLPQYLSYVFTRIPLSDYTSIGCHTALWDFTKNDYHNWVYKEHLDQLFPAIAFAETTFDVNFNGKQIKIGIGIHDSSSALIPYLRSAQEKFVLVSTGTWNIVFNPFAECSFAEDGNDHGGLNYMRVNGNPVKANRLFLGNEYKIQVRKLSKHFGVSKDYHRNMKFDYHIYSKILKDFKPMFNWESLSDYRMVNETNIRYSTFEDAYHHLMMELVSIQTDSIRKVLGEDDIDSLYIDGGFSINDLFVNLLSHSFRNLRLRTAVASVGSALGAAITVNDKKLNSEFLKENYLMKSHVPFVIN